MRGSSDRKAMQTVNGGAVYTIGGTAKHALSRAVGRRRWSQANSTPSRFPYAQARLSPGRRPAPQPSGLHLRASPSLKHASQLQAVGRRRSPPVHLRASPTLKHASQLQAIGRRRSPPVYTFALPLRSSTPLSSRPSAGAAALRSTPSRFPYAQARLSADGTLRSSMHASQPSAASARFPSLNAALGLHLRASTISLGTPQQTTLRRRMARVIDRRMARVIDRRVARA